MAEVVVNRCCGEIPIMHTDEDGHIVDMECPVCGRTVYIGSSDLFTKEQRERIDTWNKGVKKRGR
jgi:hypothetical protein